VVASLLFGVFGLSETVAAFGVQAVPAPRRTACLQKQLIVDKVNCLAAEGILPLPHCHRIA